MIHDFERKLKEGAKYEAEQDEFWKRWYAIRDASVTEDRSGIDRFFTPLKYPGEFSVQYKGDDRASASGNLFIEVVSVDATQAPGWAVKCAADYLSIYIPEWRFFYWFSMPLLRSVVPTWYTHYAIKQSENRGYNTHGICVPVKQIEESVACLRLYKEGLVPLRNQMEMPFRAIPRSGTHGVS